LGREVETVTLPIGASAQAAARQASAELRQIAQRTYRYPAEPYNIPLLGAVFAEATEHMGFVQEIAAKSTGHLP